MRVLRLKDVPNKSFDGYITNGLREEKLAESGPWDGTKARHQEQDTTESCGVLGGLVSAVLAEQDLSMILVHLYRASLAQTTYT